MLNPFPQISALSHTYPETGDTLVHQIVESLPCAALWKTPDHRIAGCNAALAELLGIDQGSEIAGKTEFDIALLCDALRVQNFEEEAIDRALAARDFDETILGRNGERIRARTRRSVIFDATGHPTAILATFTPIEEIDRRQLRQQQTQVVKRMRQIEEDLENARQVQRYLLDQPIKPCAFLETACQYRFADKVGGDFVSFRPLDENNFGFLITDLMGHGVSAALFTALLKYIAKEASDAVRRHPEIFLSYLDNRFYDQIPNGFFTALAGTFARDPETGSVTLSYANAAHPPAILVRAAGDIQLLRTETGAVGLIDDFTRRSFTVTMQRGDRLFILTDGFEEAQNLSGEEFGYERIEQALATAHGLSLADAINRLFFINEGFLGPVHPQDDRTIIAFEVK